MCSTFSSQYPTPYTPSHPCPPLLIASVINMSKNTQCPFCLRMFNSELVMRHCLQCSVRMTMANNNIFKPKITSATQPISNDTTISFEINQYSAASKLGTQSHEASANDAFNLLLETSSIQDKVSNLQDETSSPLTFGGIAESIAGSNNDQSYHPGNNDSYNSELENDGNVSKESISLISNGEENDLLMDNGDSIDTETIRLLQMIDPDEIDLFDMSNLMKMRLILFLACNKKTTTFPCLLRHSLICCEF